MKGLCLTRGFKEKDNRVVIGDSLVIEIEKHPVNKGQVRLHFKDVAEPKLKVQRYEIWDGREDGNIKEENQG